MQTRTELFHTAMRTVSARRQRARLAADEQAQALRRRLPRLAQLETARRQAGIRAALLAAQGQADADDEKTRCQNEINALLAENGYAADALEPHFTCPVCKDTGYDNGHVCGCVHTLMRQLRRDELNSSSSLSLCSFDTMQLKWYPETRLADNHTVRAYMRGILSDLREYAETFDQRSVNLLLSGNAGLGKTHAALAIAGVVLDKGYDVIYQSAPELFGQLETAHFNNDSESERALMDAVCEADFLVLDDLGTEMVTSFTLSQFYTLLNRRQAARKVTAITTNITDPALMEKRYTEKIASRLLGSFELFTFLGNDIRLLKNG